MNINSLIENILLLDEQDHLIQTQENSNTENYQSELNNLELTLQTELLARIADNNNEITNNIFTILENQFGWLGNENHQVFSPEMESLGIKCDCSICANSGFINENDPQNYTTNDTTAENSNIVYNPSINALLSGYKWNTNQVSFSFYSNSVFNGQYYGSETVSEVSEGVKNNVRSIMSWIEEVINIDFVEVTETSNNIGQIRFMLSNGPSYAYAYYPTSSSMFNLAGDVHLNPSYDHSSNTNGFQTSAGRHGFMTLFHEIGHALGLKHPHQGSTILPSAEDNTTNTVMSYNFTGNSAGTYMTYDIKALQSLYGAKAHNTGNDVYQFTNRIDQFVVNGKLYGDTPHLNKQIIWDNGGIDTLDFSNLSFSSTGYLFDLNPGGWLINKSADKGNYYNYGTSIAYDVYIENLINSSSNDEIIANSVANVFAGYFANRFTGHDIIHNTTSQDTLDLSDYSFSNIIQTQNNNDLILTLGNNGSITITDYYVGEQINLLFAGIVSLSINNVTVTEDNNAIFTVSLSSASDEVITVNYQTADNTAIAGSDYLSKDGTLIFNPGDLSQTITISIIDDLISEPTESFFVNLNNITGNAIIVNAQGIGTILDNDITIPSVSINDIALKEGTHRRAGKTTDFQFTVTLSEASNTPISVNYATADGTATVANNDYLATNGTLTFNPGETSKAITVKVVQDNIYEPDETFFVNLSSSDATIDKGQGIATIINDDTSSTNTSGGRNNKGGSKNQTSKNQIIETQVDILTGTSKADTFILGDENQTYYHQLGNDDYALIQRFDWVKDRIQLSGTKSDYSIGASPFNSKDTAIFSETNNELIAILQGDHNLDLNNGNNFIFI
jgi:serralysin